MSPVAKIGGLGENVRDVDGLTLLTRNVYTLRWIQNLLRANMSWLNHIWGKAQWDYTLHKEEVGGTADIGSFHFVTFAQNQDVYKKFEKEIKR